MCSYLQRNHSKSPKIMQECYWICSNGYLKMTECKKLNNTSQKITNKMKKSEAGQEKLHTLHDVCSKMMETLGKLGMPICDKGWAGPQSCKVKRGVASANNDMVASRQKWIFFKQNLRVLWQILTRFPPERSWRTLIKISWQCKNNSKIP